MNQMYGFEGEVKAKYTAQMFQLFSEVFQWLPLAQCMNNKVLVSSGGGIVSSYEAMELIVSKVLFTLGFKMLLDQKWTGLNTSVNNLIRTIPEHF